MPNIAESGPRIFLTYSYSEPDARELRKSFHEACIEAGTVPVLFEGFAGQDIALELRRIILSCDLVIVLVSRKPSAGISYELAYTSSVGLPIIFFEKMTELPERTTFNPIELFKFRNSQDFLHSLYGYLVHFKERYLKSQAIVRKEQESKIMSILSASLESNVLVLGKDSDSVGLQKMDTIAHTVLRRGYVPVRLKELSDITFLSPEDKMIRIAGMCRFIIAEDSRPSGHIDELRICATCQYITSTVRKAGTAATWMQAQYPLQYRFMNRFCYDGSKISPARDSLCKRVYPSLQIATKKALEWSERRISIQKGYFLSNIYSRF